MDNGSSVYRYSSMSVKGMSDEAKSHAVYDYLRNQYKVCLEQGSYNHLNLDKLFEHEIEAVTAVVMRIKDKNVQRSPYCMMTLNFPAEEHEMSLNVDIPKLLNRVWVSRYWYSYEWHNSKGKYTHPHIHILIELARTNKKQSEIIRETLSRLHDYVDNATAQMIDVKMGADFHNRLSYIKGTCKKKKKQFPKDEEVRHGFELKSWYKGKLHYIAPDYSSELYLDEHRSE